MTTGYGLRLYASFALGRVHYRRRENMNLSWRTTDYTPRQSSSVQNVRETLVYCLADKIIDEDEFLLLYDAYESENMCYSFWDYEDFSLEYPSSEECLAEFRVSKVDFPRLLEDESQDVLEVPRERFVVAAVSFIRNRNADKFLPKTRLENKPPRMCIGSKL